ncbi:MAG: xanthine dehydrogenase family protein molybdopterin-binding subunit [Chloroflexi bacterium]|nr:xanthine dehydrogenase family protein molybdopterin-binding subunit [Chloroflexota bacterium]
MTITRKPHIVGKPFPIVEGQMKLAGASTYVDDLPFGPDLLYCRLVLSPTPHARIISVDATQAKSLEGVHGVFSGAEIVGRTGLNIADRPILAGDRVLWAGQPVAVVVAESPEIAEAAAALVRVEYEAMDAVLDMDMSMASQIGPIHPEMERYKMREHVHPTPRSNIGHHVERHRGDMKQGWKEADIVLEDVYEAPPVQHASIEPHGAVARMDEEGRITLWASTQAPFVQRQLIADALDLPIERLRVVTHCVGGGFGGKALVSIEAIVVAVAMQLPERPIKLVLTRAEEFTCTFLRPGFKARVRMGATKAGKLTALEATYYWDCGASIDAGVDMAWASVYAGCGPYHIDNVSITSLCLYTNRPPTGPMRGHGMSEIHWAIEQHMDRMAQLVGLDPVEFRFRNALKGGDVIFGDQVMHTFGLEQCIRRVSRALNGPQKGVRPDGRAKRRGAGIAAMWSPTLLGHIVGSMAWVRLDDSGPVHLMVGGVEVGQGLRTLAVQLAASTLGVPLNWVRIGSVDTDESPFQWQMLTTSLTWSVGNAVLEAAQQAKARVLEAVARAWDEPTGNLDIVDGVVISYGSERSLSLLDLLSDGVTTPEGEFIAGRFEGKGAFSPNTSAGYGDDSEWPLLPLMHFSAGAQGVELEVDVETGEIEILRCVSAIDVGHALNPIIVSSQIKGGAVQGVSIGLLEEVQFDDGRVQNASFRDYRLATTLDAPAKLQPIIVEIPQGDGPFGARGVGEHALIAIAPAIANALHQAVGVRITRLPLTAERVWEALQEADFDKEAT